MTQPDTAPGPSSAYWTPERCAQEARFWEGANQDERAADFDWSFDQALPLSTMTGDGLRTPADWVAWMKGEIVEAAKEGHPGKYGIRKVRLIATRNSASKGPLALDGINLNHKRSNKNLS